MGRVGALRNTFVGNCILIACYYSIRLANTLLFMKHAVCFSFIFLCFILSASGQALSLDELLKLQGKNIEDFGDYVEARGFHFHSSTNEEDAHSVQYAIENKDSSIAYIGWRTKLDRVQITFVFETFEIYKSIKSRLLPLGFKYYGSKTDSDTFGSMYESATLEAFVDKSIIKGADHPVYVVKIQQPKTK